MLLTVLIVLWLVAAIVLSSVVGVRGWRVFRRVKRLQAEVDRQLPKSRFDELNARLAALQEKQGELQEATASLQRAMARLTVLRDAVDDAAAPVVALRALFRR